MLVCHAEVPDSEIYMDYIYFSHDFWCSLRLSTCVSMALAIQRFPCAGHECVRVPYI